MDIIKIDSPAFIGERDPNLSEAYNNNNKSNYSNFPHGYNFTSKPYTNNQ